MDNNRFFEEKEIIWINKITWMCPTCNTESVFALDKSCHPNYCAKCGQKIKYVTSKLIDFI